MANTYVNKVVVNGVTKIDLTGDTVTAATLLSGQTAHSRSGAQITGTMPSVATATADATAAAADILKDKTAYVAGTKVTGTMPNIGEQTITITDLTAKTISLGYHDGSGSAQISSADAAKIIPANIRENITFLGVTGTMSGSEGMNPQAKSATPTFASQEILPDSDYNCLSSVTIAAIPVTYTDNAQGGQTCTIG